MEVTAGNLSFLRSVCASNFPFEPEADAELAHRVPCNACAFTTRATPGSGSERPGTNDSPEVLECPILLSLSAAASLCNTAALNDPGRAESFF